MSDLSDLNVNKGANEGFEYHVLHPSDNTPLYTDNGEPITITVLGRYSDAYIRANKNSGNRRLSAASRSRGGRASVTMDEIEGDATEIMVACVTSWKNITVDGQVLECNPKNVRRVIMDDRFRWLREQIDEAINTDSNFMRKSKTNSSEKKETEESAQAAG